MDGRDVEYQADFEFRISNSNACDGVLFHPCRYCFEHRMGMVRGGRAAREKGCEVGFLGVRGRDLDVEIAVYACLCYAGRTEEAKGEGFGGSGYKC